MPEGQCINCANFDLDPSELEDGMRHALYSHICPFCREHNFGGMRIETVWDCEEYIPILKPTPKPKNKKPLYKSKDGFELVALRRGFTEIRPLWDILEQVKVDTREDCFICGGYARWCASPKFEPIPAGDIDIYCESERVFDTVRRYLKNANLTVKHENNMAITYNRPVSGEYHIMFPIQLIKPVVSGAIVARGDKEKILSNFDFTVIRAAIKTPTTVLVDADFTEDETHKRLRLKNIHNPLSSLLRCCKYTKKGYFLPFTEAIKLFYAWDGMNSELKTEFSDVITAIRNGDIIEDEKMTSWYEIFRGRKQ